MKLILVLLGGRNNQWGVLVGTWTEIQYAPLSEGTPAVWFGGGGGFGGLGLVPGLCHQPLMTITRWQAGALDQKISKLDMVSVHLKRNSDCLLLNNST